MGLFVLALKSLKTDLLKSLFYFLSFILTTIFIFLFFNLTFNPATGINLGGQDSTIITPIATFVILIAMVCVFMANDYYVLAKTKDVSIVLMSGASVYQVGTYLLIQSTIIMILAIPLGLLISYLLVPIINNVFFIAFNFKGQLNNVNDKAYIATAIILFCEIGWCTLLNMGYCYRTSINSMVNNNVKIENFGFGIKKLSNKLYTGLFILPMFIFPWLKDTSSSLLLSIIGMIGLYGVIKYVIPNFIDNRQTNEALENRYMLITLGNVKYDLQKLRPLVIITMLSSILLMCVTISTLKQPLVSMIVLMSYGSVIILLAITTIFKVGMELQTRKKSYINLYHLGYDLKDLKKIILDEMIIFYGIIIIVPLLYQILIIIRLYILGLVSLYLIGIILVIQILPMLICMFITTKMYLKILPKATII